MARVNPNLWSSLPIQPPCHKEPCCSDVTNKTSYWRRKSGGGGNDWWGSRYCHWHCSCLPPSSTTCFIFHLVKDVLFHVRDNHSCPSFLVPAKRSQNEESSYVAGLSAKSQVHSNCSCNSNLWSGQWSVIYVSGSSVYSSYLGLARVRLPVLQSVEIWFEYQLARQTLELWSVCDFYFYLGNYWILYNYVPS